jgi:hypothetical protein
MKNDYIQSMRKLLVIFLFSSAGAVFGQTKITAQEASKHVGDSVVVFDKVYDGQLLKNGMTILNVGGRSPKQLLVVLIKPEHRAKFSFKPEVQFKDKRVIISGVIIDHKGRPEIFIKDAEEIIESEITDPRPYLKKQYLP